MKQRPDSFTIELQCGRRTVLTARPYFQAIVSGSEDAQFYAISALRMNAARPETLCQQLVVEQDAHATPVCVSDILDGCTDWSLKEIKQLRESLTRSPEFSTWLEATFADLCACIRNSPVFGSNLVENDFDLGKPNPDMLLRAVVLKAALKPDAMQILRQKFASGYGC